MCDDQMDLTVWLEPDGSFHGFQLCYDKDGRERAFTWMVAGGFSHHAVESGETKPNSKRTPILVAESHVPLETIKREFLERSSKLDSMVREFVAAKLDKYELEEHVGTSPKSPG